MGESSDIAIRVENLGKRYRLGERDPYLTFREAIRHWCGAPVRKLAAAARNGLRQATGSEETFWALRDVSFEVKRGEVLGIIGRNGAGKSTLLKILTRITKPSTGRAEIHGRVGSLLEVGTGFHPELTGRENIFLNGAILGMTRKEIRSKFDEIVAFSGVEKFLDTPVKRHSSGMRVRLAFAVAAHLEPEILLIDEVLAVGDAEFQKKCLGKMSEVARGGRTILFVSHNMDAVKRLCTRGIWLEQGEIHFAGTGDDCVSHYLLAGLRDGGRVEFDPPHPLPNGMPARLLAVQISDGNGCVKQKFSASDALDIRIEWELGQRLYKPRIGFVLYTSDAIEVLTALDAQSWKDEWLSPGRYLSTCTIPGQLLNEGSYVLSFSGDAPRKFAGADQAFDFRRGLTGGLLRFEIDDDMTLSNRYYGEEGFRDARFPGVLLLNLPWTQRPR